MYFVLMGEWNPPDQGIHTRGKTFQPAKMKARAKRSESHCCAVNTLGACACNFSTFLRFLTGTHFRKLPTESEWSDRF